jgi:hypothetical protein
MVGCGPILTLQNRVDQNIIEIQSYPTAGTRA